MKRLFVLSLFLAIPAVLSAQTLPVTFQWDASATVGTADNPIKYNMCHSAAAPVGGGLPADRVCVDAATALEALVQAPRGVRFYFATARMFALTVDGALSGDVMESGPSNVLRVEVFAPPGNPSKIRIKSVTQAMDTSSGQTVNMAGTVH